jgi:hypothetical protein
MNKNLLNRIVRACLGAVLVMPGVLSVATDEAKAASSAEAPGNAGNPVSAAGPDGRPVTRSVSQSFTSAQSSGSNTQSSSVTVSSDGTNQKVTVTTVGPDGKVDTVSNEGKDGKMPPIPLHLPDGRKLALSLHPAPTRIERVTYAGIGVEEVPEVVSKHLPIPKGMGLVVTEVLTDSPADKAGIRKDDILLRFDDQLLATKEQLRKLTRSRKSGDKVRFSVLHEGRETAVEVTFSERDEDVANPGPGPWQPFGWMKGGAGGLPNLREAAEQAKSKAADLAKTAEEVRRRLGSAGGRFENRGEAGSQAVPGMEAVERLEREVRRLREEMEHLRGPASGPSAEGERGDRQRGGSREGMRPPGGPRDGERPPGGPRDGERPPGGPRDGERPPGGPRDGERPPGGPPDGGRP